MTRRPHRARGAALLTAMLTVTLVATFAAAALWQQWRSVEVEAAERDRLQAAWVLAGALDWARLILREDGRSGGADHLAEPWAVPLEEARLSSFLAADKNNNSAGAEDALDAFLSGQIIDLQSRLNVRNLVDGNGKVSEAGLAAFNKLFELLGLPTEPLPALAQALARASDATTQSAPLMPQHVSQLVWFGLAPSTVAAIAPYVTVLPNPTAVNLNTASAPVIYASVPALEIADAQRLVAARARTHFRSVADAANAAGLSTALFDESRQSYLTRYFEVRGTLRLAQTIVEERSLVQRDGLNVTTLWRERIARDPQAAAAQNPP